MLSSAIKFSVVIGFRNRDIVRVTRCIESFAAQTLQNFELIFVDYGSDPEIASSVKKFLNNYSFIKYIYNDTRGWFWNRAHALNTGLVNSAGTYIISSDIDMIHAPNFMEALDRTVEPRTLYHYRCYYLPENFHDSILLNAGDNLDLPVSSEEAQGLLVVERAACQQVNGWNEKFKIYGGEDNDMSRRLVNSGLHIHWLPPDTFVTYHQWHPSHKKSIEILPHKWKQRMGSYVTLPNKSSHQEGMLIGKIYTPAERHSFKDENPCAQYELTAFFSEQIFSFLEAYMASESGSAFLLFCHYNNDLYNFQKRDEPLNNLLKLINFVLKKARLRLGLQLRYLAEPFSPDIFHARDAVFYLLEHLMTVGAVRDYQFVFNEEKLELTVIRR